MVKLRLVKLTLSQSREEKKYRSNYGFYKVGVLLSMSSVCILILIYVRNETINSSDLFREKIVLFWYRFVWCSYTVHVTPTRYVDLVIAVVVIIVFSSFFLFSPSTHSLSLSRLQRFFWHCYFYIMSFRQRLTMNRVTVYNKILPIKDGPIDRENDDKCASTNYT